MCNFFKKRKKNFHNTYTFYYIFWKCCFNLFHDLVIGKKKKPHKTQFLLTYGKKKKNTLFLTGFEIKVFIEEIVSF